MRSLFRLIGWTAVDLFRSRAALEPEIWTLRQQANVLRRTAPKRLSFSVFDRLIFVGLYRLFPKSRDRIRNPGRPYPCGAAVSGARCAQRGRGPLLSGRRADL